MLEELQQRAENKREEVDSDPTKDSGYKLMANNIVKFLKDGNNFNKVPKSVGESIIYYLGYEDYEKVYEEIMKEVNKKYVYVDMEKIR